MSADLEMIEEITERAEHMKLGLVAYPVEEIKALCEEVRRLRTSHRPPFQVIDGDRP